MKLGAWLIMLSTMIMFISLVGLDIPGLNPINEAIGFQINESNSAVISADVESSSFWNKLFGTTAFSLFGMDFTAGILIALAGTGAVIVGLFAKGYDTSLVILPFVLFVAGLFISTFWAIIGYTTGGENPQWLTAIVALIFTGLAVGFVMACVDYFARR